VKFGSKEMKMSIMGSICLRDTAINCEFILSSLNHVDGIDHMLFGSSLLGYTTVMCDTIAIH
jgi:hypothetical protein